MDIKSNAMDENNTARRTEDGSAQAAQTKIARRDFLKLAVAAGAAIAASRVPGLGVAGGGGTVTRYPLRIPPGASPSSFGLTAAPSTVDVGGGQLSSVLAYNNSFPGPTFRANTGDTASIQFTNGLSEATTVHWHGMVVPTAADGQPQNLVAPGASYSYQFPIRQRACGSVLGWADPVRQPLPRLLMLARDDCWVRAWLQFGRAPAADDRRIADLRYGGRSNGNFTDMRLLPPDSARVCPPHLTHWGMPRADLFAR